VPTTECVNYEIGVAIFVKSVMVFERIQYSTTVTTVLDGTS
jgi:hypothetical protein